MKSLQTLTSLNKKGGLKYKKGVLKIFPKAECYIKTNHYSHGDKCIIWWTFHIKGCGPLTSIGRTHGEAWWNIKTQLEKLKKS